jgi:hypothetical protein
MTLTPIQRAVEIFAVIHLGLMGLSHVFNHRAWAEFFISLRARGRAGVFVHGFLALSFGAVIVALHRVWSGRPMVLSIVGALYLVKAIQCFVLPGLSLRSLQRVTLERSPMFIGAGVMFLVVAGVTVMSLLGV